MMTNANHIQQTREHDYDRFLAIQLAPAATRAHLYTITAFSLELARIAEVVSDPLIGHIRAAWWREALDEIEAGKKPRNHPTVLALAQLHTTHPEIFPLLHQIIDARAADLDTSLIAQENAWRDYCDHTAGNLHLAFATILDATAAHEHATTIRAQAQAFAMVGLIRAIPFMTAQGWLRFPHARLNAHNLETLTPSPALPTFVQSILTDATTLNTAPKLPRTLKPLNALSALTTLHTQQLTRAAHDPYHLRPTKLAAVWRTLWV